MTILDRESLLRLKEQAETEKADWIEKINESEKTLAQVNAARQELIGRANQAVGAIAAIDKLLEGDAEMLATDPPSNKRRGKK